MLKLSIPVNVVLNEGTRGTTGTAHCIIGNMVIKKKIPLQHFAPGPLRCPLVGERAILKHGTQIQYNEKAIVSRRRSERMVRQSQGALGKGCRGTMIGAGGGGAIIGGGPGGSAITVTKKIIGELKELKKVSYMLVNLITNQGYYGP